MTESHLPTQRGDPLTQPCITLIYIGPGVFITSLVSTSFFDFGTQRVFS